MDYSSLYTNDNNRYFIIINSGECYNIISELGNNNSIIISKTELNLYEKIEFNNYNLKLIINKFPKLRYIIINYDNPKKNPTIINKYNEISIIYSWLDIYNLFK